MITGPSCSGKSTLENNLVRHAGLQKITSFTTREARPGEVDGKDYHFISDEAAMDLLADNKVAEHVEFDGNIYGITTEELSSCLNKGHTIVVVEPKGQRILVETCITLGKPYFTIALTPPIMLLCHRFLERFENDYSTRTSVYSQRLETLIVKELPNFYYRNGDPEVSNLRGKVIGFSSPVDFGFKEWNTILAELERK